MTWYIRALKHYAEFSGRARRKEFWYFILFNTLFFVILAGIDIAILGPGGGTGILSGIFLLGTLLPGLGVTVRRLHDTGRSGWWFCISLVPLIGSIVLLVFLVQDGTHGNNGYGIDPKKISL